VSPDGDGVAARVAGDLLSLVALGAGGLAPATVSRRGQRSL